MNFLKSKALFYIVVGVLTFIGLFYYINQVLRKPSADAPPVNITFLPASGTYDPNSDQDINVVLQPRDAGNKISGFDLVFTASSGSQFVMVSDPVNIANSDGSIFTQIRKDVAPTNVRLAYAVIKPDTELPEGVRFTITHKATTAASGIITLNKNVSEASGNIPENVYGWGIVNEGLFTYAASTPTPTPTDTPTPTLAPTSTPIPTETPTPTLEPTNVPTAVPTATSAPLPTPGCATKPQGDANCDGSTNLTDFEVWRKEFTGLLPTSTGDFDGNGTVNLIDFEVWRSNI